MTVLSNLKDEVITRWSNLFFLEGIEGKIKIKNVAYGMEFMRNELVQEIGDKDENEVYPKGFTTVMFPIIRRILVDIEEELHFDDILKHVKFIIKDFNSKYSEFIMDNPESTGVDYKDDELPIFTMNYSNWFIKNKLNG